MEEIGYPLCCKMGIIFLLTQKPPCGQSFVLGSHTVQSYNSPRRQRLYDYGTRKNEQYQEGCQVLQLWLPIDHNWPYL